MNDVMKHMKPSSSYHGPWFSRHSRGDPSWRPLAAFSLALTFCAGFMALCFWTIRLDFDPSWWGANLFLAIWPCFFLPRLAR